MNILGPKYVSTQWELKQPRNDISNTQEWYNFRRIDIAFLALTHQPRLHFMNELKDRSSIFWKDLAYQKIKILELGCVNMYEVG